MGWIAYVIGWLAAAFFWSLASASASGRPPLETLPWGVLAMGTAGLMGLVVWRLTERVAWDWRAPSFYIAHGIGLVVYSVLYSTSWVWLDVALGRLPEAIAAIRRSPVMIWNLLMGSLAVSRGRRPLVRNPRASSDPRRGNGGRRSAPARAAGAARRAARAGQPALSLQRPALGRRPGGERSRARRQSAGVPWRSAPVCARHGRRGAVRTGVALHAGLPGVRAVAPRRPAEG